MHKLFSLSKQNQTGGGKTGHRVSAGELRVQKDLDALELPPSTKIEYPDKDDILNFKIIMTPREGIYKDGTFTFTFQISTEYPHQVPKVHCDTKIFHPNIDTEGHICLNILREGWSPILTLNAVIFGLEFLFLEPNPDDPLNKEAAKLLKSDRYQFEQKAKRVMRGDNYY
ncbi:nedd8-conjugating enzyme ubc12 [Anaeramoeba ignava]|uniref:Nedd8-conjugating enzyme ubc12 n=1 Tax=Anaeramoeba ignava TaxID=1746090 RepID=A0A9Q0LL62_ANAIG|nr:nedd8-conjugating enzyme ubc12 [Anaeramoeba ignava]